MVDEKGGGPARVPGLAPRGALQGRGLRKDYGGVPVLQEVDVDVVAGEILAIVGANGAGKSTLLNILSGIIPGDYSGQLFRTGEEVQFASVKDAESHGVGLVPQELLVLPAATVLDNIYFGTHPARRGFVREQAARERALAVLEGLAATDIDLDQPIHELGASRQQQVQLARVLLHEPDVLLFDEPTSSLPTREVQSVLDTMQRLAAAGKAIVFVTHRLPEVFAVSDRIQVLRDGRSVNVWRAAQATPGELVEAMLGKELESVEERRRGAADKSLPVVLEVAALCTKATRGAVNLDEVSLTVREGEILGLYGLVGAGRTELLEAIFGVGGRPAAGEIRLRGIDIKRHSLGRRIESGLALVTEDRKRTGLVLEMNIAQNVSLVSLNAVSQRGFRNTHREMEAAEDWIRQLGIRCRLATQTVSTLSGGNQQKVVIAKWLATHPRLLLLDEPTRGIDVGAKVEIFRIIEGLAREGVSMIFTSSDPEEILAVSNRAIVMYRGRIVTELEGQYLTEAALVSAAAGLATAAA